MTKNTQTIERMKATKRLLDDTFKAFNKAKTEADKNWYLETIQTIAISLSNSAYDVQNEE